MDHCTLGPTHSTKTINDQKNFEEHLERDFPLGTSKRILRIFEAGGLEVRYAEAERRLDSLQV